jgi:hypothetical protein
MHAVLTGQHLNATFKPHTANHNFSVCPVSVKVLRKTGTPLPTVINVRVYVLVVMIINIRSTIF